MDNDKSKNIDSFDPSLLIKGVSVVESFKVSVRRLSRQTEPSDTRKIVWYDWRDRTFTLVIDK